MISDPFQDRQRRDGSDHICDHSNSELPDIRIYREVVSAS